MKIEWNPSALRETRIHEYVTRFFFGGLCTVVAGLVAKHYGPGIGGLFLAFPAIFPASATMIENHEKRKKAEIGRNGTMRGRMAASIDAAGTARGTIGLGAFALLVWKLLPHQNAIGVIAAAVMLWAGTSYLCWAIRKV
jgi:hypothetical protein